ncbi:hypothetical protein [Streptomyces cyaneofuscatus]|uniref:hypothetical protein n=1 Tax=Streptomyces cyaneofuscatus TaxID=66883 RepID=UPI003434C01A|nr:hypothetical protein [Streptomyces sp. MT29]
MPTPRAERAVIAAVCCLIVLALSWPLWSALLEHVRAMALNEWCGQPAAPLLSVCDLPSKAGS